MISDLVPDLQGAVDSVPVWTLGKPSRPFEQLMVIDFDFERSVVKTVMPPACAA